MAAEPSAAAAKPAANAAAEGKLNLSLDDIIKREEKLKQQKRPYKAGSQGQRGGGGGGRGQHTGRGGGSSNGGGSQQRPGRGGGGGGDGRGGRGGGFQQRPQQHRQQQGRGPQQQQQQLQQLPEGSMFIPAHMVGQLAAHLPGMGLPPMGPGFGMAPAIMAGMPQPMHPQAHAAMPHAAAHFGGPQHAAPAPPAKPPIVVSRLPEQYRNALQVHEEEEAGDVVAVFKRADIVRIRPSGEVVLDAAGMVGLPVFQALNEVVQRIGLKVVAIGDVHNGSWNVSDGRSSQRFVDGMVVPAKGPASAGRARTVLAAFQDVGSSAAEEAEAASTAAAIAAGLLPPEAAAPKRGGHGGGRGGGGGHWRGGGRGGFGGGGYAQREHATNGHVPLSNGQDAAEIRRLKAQGRWAPY